MAAPKVLIPRQTKRLVNTLNRTENIQTWDYDNAYAQRIKDLCNASGVATRCIKGIRVLSLVEALPILPLINK